MASFAERIANELAAPQMLDPADGDGFDDNTTAKLRHDSADLAQVEGLTAPSKGRLRMRAGIPELAAYKGKAIDRGSIFEDVSVAPAGAVVAPRKRKAAKRKAAEEEDDAAASGLDDEDVDGEVAVDTSGAMRGFTISSKLEKEYDRLMSQTEKELEVMRTPSAAEVVSKKGEAQRVQRQLDTWKALVEFRIYLESVLSVGHRLPVGDDAAAFREADPAVSKESDAVARDLQEALSSLLVLQQRLAEHDGVEVPSEGSKSGSATQEASVWSSVDARLESVLDRGLEVADEWKERTRLDSRRSFKVLDQPLRAQMQAVAEVPEAKLRKRCTPAPGKYQIFGAPVAAEGDGADAAEEERTSNIFDDRDFYVQLLREVLASGGAAASGLDGEQARDLAEVQGRRAAKKARRADVERRASKGRKIRYVPIEKLQNFMSARTKSIPGAGEAAEPLQAHAAEALLSSLFASAA